MSSEVQERLQRLEQSINSKYDTIEALETLLIAQERTLQEVAQRPPSAVALSAAELQLAKVNHETAVLQEERTRTKDKIAALAAGNASSEEEVNASMARYSALWTKAAFNSSCLVDYKMKSLEDVGRFKERRDMSAEDLRSLLASPSPSSRSAPASDITASIGRRAQESKEVQSKRKLLEKMQSRHLEQKLKLQKLRSENEKLRNQLVAKYL